MKKLLVWLIKIFLYVVFGYIPLLIVCVLASGGLTALVVQTVDYCYGSLLCFAHGVVIGVGGIYGGFCLSLIIVAYFIEIQEHRKPKQKRKHEEFS